MDTELKNRRQLLKNWETQNQQETKKDKRKRLQTEAESQMLRQLPNLELMALKALQQRGRQTLSQLLDRGLKRNMISVAEKYGILLRTFDPTTNLYHYTVNDDLFKDSGFA